MRAYRWLVALVFMAGGLHAQTVGSLASSACPLGGCAQGGTGTVTTTGTLASGQVALGSGATSITGDTGLTHSGTGTGFKLGIGTDVFLSRASAGLLLVEDGSGNPRDVQARTVFVGNGTSLAPSIAPAAWPDEGLYFNNAAIRFGIGGLPIAVLSGTGGSAGAFLNLLAPRGIILTSASGEVTVRPSTANNTLEIGDLPSATPVANALVVGESGVGTNIAGGNGTISSGAGTGSATGSSIIFQTPTATTSGTTAQTQTTRLTISEAGVTSAFRFIAPGGFQATGSSGVVVADANVSLLGYYATTVGYTSAATGAVATRAHLFTNDAGSAVNGAVTGPNDSGITALTESSATGFATLTYAASEAVSAEFLVRIKANDATDFQSLTSRVRVSSIRKATGNTISKLEVIGDTNPTALLPAESAGGSTLSCTYTITEGAAAVTVLANCVSSLTQTTLNASFVAETVGNVKVDQL